MKYVKFKSVKPLACLLVTLFLVIPGASLAKSITLKGLSVFEPSRDAVIALPWLAQKVEEKSGGDLKINIIGGPDIIPIPEQAQALADGTVDILIIFTATFEDKVPQAVPLVASQKTPWEERENGFYDWFNAKLNKINMRYICRGQTGFEYFYFSKNKITSLGEFKSQKVGATPLWIPFMKALGTVPVLIDEPNLYTALSRGTVNAVVLPPDSVVDLGLYEVSKYIIGPKFYYSGNMVIFMNLDKWNKLTPEQQNIMLEAGAEVERDVATYFQEVLNNHLVNLQEKYNMEKVELSPEESKTYVDTANRVIWEKAKEKNSAEDYETLVKFLQ